MCRLGCTVFGLVLLLSLLWYLRVWPVREIQKVLVMLANKKNLKFELAANADITQMYEAIIQKKFLFQVISQFCTFRYRFLVVSLQVPFPVIMLPPSFLHKNSNANANAIVDRCCVIHMIKSKQLICVYHTYDLKCVYRYMFNKRCT